MPIPRQLFGICQPYNKGNFFLKNWMKAESLPVGPRWSDPFLVFFCNVKTLQHRWSDICVELHKAFIGRHIFASQCLNKLLYSDPVVSRWKVKIRSWGWKNSGSNIMNIKESSSAFIHIHLCLEIVWTKDELSKCSWTRNSREMRSATVTPALTQDRKPNDTNEKIQTPIYSFIIMSQF